MIKKKFDSIRINKNLKIPYQIDPKLIVNINKFGCRFMCLLAIPQFYLNKALSTDQILEIYDICVQQGPNVMAKDCTCGPNEAFIMDQAFRMLGDNTHRCKQLFTSDAAKHYKKRNMLPSKSNVLFYIFDFRTTSSIEYGGKHFMLADFNGDLIYDPGHGTVDSSIIRFGRWLCYKIFSDKKISKFN